MCLLQQNKVVKTKKTELVKRTTNPGFNESFTFKLPVSSLDIASISLTAVQRLTGFKGQRRAPLSPDLYLSRLVDCRARASRTRLAQRFHSFKPTVRFPWSVFWSGFGADFVCASSAQNTRCFLKRTLPL